MADYCNTTTHLQRVLTNLEQYQHMDVLAGWTLDSGVTYSKFGTGSSPMVFEGGNQYVEKSSIATVEATSSTFWYDSSVDKLYIHTSDDTAPSNFQIEYGEVWETLKTAKRDEAQVDVDSYLNKMYRTPLMPRTVLSHNSDEFDSVIVRATALFTVSKIVERTDPDLGRDLWNQAINFDEDLPKGILNELLDGDRVLADQISSREPTSYNVRQFNASNSTAIEPVFSGTYTGSYYEVWRLQIDTSGAPGTSTWKLSTDGGASFDPTLQKTFDTNVANRRVLIRSGVYAFFPVTLTSGDWWDLEVFPLSDSSSVVGAKIGNIKLSRGC